MQGVGGAPAAVLPELDAVRGVPLRLLGLVVAPFALGARERDCDSDSGLGHGFLPSVGAIAAGGFEPPTCGL